MGATRNTGYLENLIQYDASDNVAIATSVNPSYKVTLGGSLLGTSAVFNGSITAGGNITINANGSQANNRLFTLSNGYMYLDGNTNGLILENNSTSSTRIRLEAADTIRFETTSLERLRITSAGDMYLTGRSTNGDYGMYFYSNDTDSRIYSSNSGAVSKSLIFYTSGTERLRIRSGGEVSFIPTTWTYVNPNTTYRNMDIGAAGFLYRDASDAYLLSNHYYNSSGQNIAKYTYSEGIGAFAFAGGNLTWYSYGASVTAGSAYATTPRFTVTYTGNVGIGDTTVNSRLFVKSDAATNGLSVKGAGNGGTYPFRVTWTNGTEGDMLCVNDAGRVGIGTTNPREIQHNVITSSGSGLLLNNSTGGSGASVSLDFNTYSTTIAGFANYAATIKAIDDGNYSAHITFLTKGGSAGASQTERMRITSGGQVRVGTSTSNLGGNVIFSTGSSGAFGIIASAQGTGTYDTGISINQGSAGQAIILLVSRHTDAGTATSAAIYLIKCYFDGNNTPAMTFIGGDNFVTIGKSGSNTITLTTSGSAQVQYTLMGNK